MRPLRVVLFGSGGPFSTIALAELAKTGQLVAVVVPGGRRGLRQLIRPRAIERMAREHGLPLIRFERSSIAGALQRLSPDLLCVASFPRRLDASVRGAARLGAVNAHPSLLPRHRGPDPIFWTFHAGDRESGVTTHWMDDGIDSGDVILQETIAVPHGVTGIELYLQLSRVAARLLATTIESIAAGTAARTPQGHGEAEPAAARRTWSIDYDTIDTARLWHFLGGLAERPGAALPDRDGAWHRIGRRRQQRPGVPAAAPGTIVRRRGVVTVHTRDGAIDCDAPRFADRLRSRIARAFRRRETAGA